MPRYEYRTLHPDAEKSFLAWIDHLDKEFSSPDPVHRSVIVRDALHQMEESFERAGQPIQFPHDHDVPRPQLIEQPVQLRTVPAPARGALESDIALRFDRRSIERCPAKFATSILVRRFHSLSVSRSMPGSSS